jgi:hypothetical protein
VKVFRWGENRREAKSFPTILIEGSSDSKAVGPGEETDGFAFVPPYMPLPGRHIGLSNRHSGGPLAGPTLWKHVLPPEAFLGPGSAHRAFAWGKEEAPTGSVCQGRVFNWPFGGCAATTLRDAGGSEAITRQCRDGTFGKPATRICAARQVKQKAPARAGARTLGVLSFVLPQIHPRDSSTIKILNPIRGLNCADKM